MSETQKNYNVIVNDSAKLMMLEHMTFLAQANIPAAERLLDGFEKAFDSLSTFPYRCPVFETTYTTSQYRRILVDRYALLFIIDEQRSIVSIECIWDTRQNLVLP